ncbi:thiaminase II [Aquibacillus koreensis]|uniref:Aminopyrimidine aminohydrolase n=1 Tax=Aquibacillus koreensis TaxID=279446 RepID=A0A9X3WKV2_9BACI|nr:thiaminase II [Aquibacillus koreensis]MCT2534267.1 thiaminase II [Aquibacillus koreensis]MDC3420688.1 thiaminase II [Aquibacillus koreensis]
MKFSEIVRKEADHIWQASFEHPFVTGISDGTLPLENFRYYVMQDSYYLAHFARVQSLGAAKAQDLHTTNNMAAHAQGTYEAELSLHRTFSKLLKITEEDQQAFEPSPTAYAYTSHLYRAGYNGHLGDIIAAILPCYWLYYEIGERLQACKPEEPIYQEWIGAYGGEWFRTLVQEQIDRLDEIAEQVTDADRNRMKDHFIISSQYEFSFWEMAYTLEKWPVQDQK